MSYGELSRLLRLPAGTLDVASVPTLASYAEPAAHFIFALTGNPQKIDDFVDLMRPIGLVEVSRAGVAAISRGPERI